MGNVVDAHNLGMMTGADGGYVLFPDRQTVRVSEVACGERDRIPASDERTRFLQLAPDLTVEVLSPTDRMVDALGKISMDLEAGVRVVWLVDPVSRTMAVVKPDRAIAILGEHDIIAGDDVLAGFAMPVAQLLGP